MPDHPQHNFTTTELDPDHLSMPFKVQTNWHVVTGAPCSGKTTLIDQLAEGGFQTAPETGRLYFEQAMARGPRMTSRLIFSTSGSSGITAPWAIPS